MTSCIFMVERELEGRPRTGSRRWSGVARKLVGVEIGGASLGAYNDGLMPDFFAVSKGGREVGKVTSGCCSPRLEKNIGFAMVPTELSEIGTELQARRPTPAGTPRRRCPPRPV
jgi:glycine cleavage system aminomethyltransferase T